MSKLYWLSDAEWSRLEPLLPRSRRGAHRVDDRRVISGIVHMLRSGARWRDCPSEYGPYTTIYNGLIAGVAKASGWQCLRRGRGRKGSSAPGRTAALPLRDNPPPPAGKGRPQRNDRALAWRTYDGDPCAER